MQTARPSVSRSASSLLVMSSVCSSPRDRISRSSLPSRSPQCRASSGACLKAAIFIRYEFVTPVHDKLAGRASSGVGLGWEKPTPSPAEEARPEAAVLEGIQLGFEPDAVLREGRLLLRDLGVLLDQAAPLFEAGLVVLALLQQALVALEGDGGQAGVGGRRIVPDHLAVEDFLLGRLGLEPAGQVQDLVQGEADLPVPAAFGAQPAVLNEEADL